MNGFLTMTHNELVIGWEEARARFNEARANKIEADRIYLAAANQLNTFERLIKKVDRQKASEQRKVTKALQLTCASEARVVRAERGGPAGADQGAASQAVGHPRLGAVRARS